ncbi:MAG: DNA translocase FtsK [Dehalococcoidia bacterium]|nr:DNA translocase FtsK [Dehalococcoidia bacterium]
MTSKLTTIADTAFLLGIVISAVFIFLFIPSSHQWAAESLAFGWIPVLAFAVITLGLLRYKPRFLVKYWRYLLSLAVAAFVVVVALSFVQADYGVLSKTSFGGQWGQNMAGDHVFITVLRLALLAAVTPLILYPKKYTRLYLSTLNKVSIRLWRVSTVIFKLLARISKYLSIYTYYLVNSRHRRLLVKRFRSYLLGPSDDQKDSNNDRENTLESSDVEIEESDPYPDNTTAPESSSRDSVAAGNTKKVPSAKSKWRLPALNLLSTPEPYLAPKGSLEQMAGQIESALADHSVIVEVKDIKAGPRIVRFGLVPGWIPRRGESNKPDGEIERSRVKVQSILTREKDLALALKTPYLRIEAPVPGEALVGLEVPNPSPSRVLLRQVMDSPAFKSIMNKGGLPIALGEDTGGNPVSTDLAGLPHILIAGATGSGKSVCINSIVASLLFTKPPDQLRVLMVDPKRVELTPFNGIPHLIAPVIVDVDKVNPALRAMMREMFLRYKLMEDIGTRNIAGYNAKSKEKMPYLVLIVDELADLMMVGGFEIEQNLVRLAQLGRATGIHLVLATQRPSVNVVTGLLKANIPARVAFAVASQVDSRVILDTVGAEKLLGRGDMLLLNNDSPKSRRVQGTLVYDEEVDRLVDFWTNQKGPPLPEISIEDSEDLEPETDHLDSQMLGQARDLAMTNPYLSSSVLERRLKIGGNKASKIIEALEDEGLVIPH